MCARTECWRVRVERLSNFDDDSSSLLKESPLASSLTVPTLTELQGFRIVEAQVQFLLAEKLCTGDAPTLNVTRKHGVVP